MKYDQGIKKEEVVTLEISKYELEQLIENDFRYRLANSDNPQEINRRTPQEIIGEWNRQEYNSWQTHNRRKVNFQKTDTEATDLDWQELIADHTHLEKQEQQEEYEAICQRLYQMLKPKQAEMIIAICIDGMSVKDYADLIEDDYWRVYKRFDYAKSLLRKLLENK